MCKGTIHRNMWKSVFTPCITCYGKYRKCYNQKQWFFLSCLFVRLIFISSKDKVPWKCRLPGISKMQNSN